MDYGKGWFVFSSLLSLSLLLLFFFDLASLSFSLIHSHSLSLPSLSSLSLSPPLSSRPSLMQHLSKKKSDIVTNELLLNIPHLFTSDLPGATALTPHVIFNLSKVWVTLLSLSSRSSLSTCSADLLTGLHTNEEHSEHRPRGLLENSCHSLLSAFCFVYLFPSLFSLLPLLFSLLSSPPLSSISL